MAASDFLHIFTQSIKFKICDYRILNRVQLFQKSESSDKQKLMVVLFSKFYKEISLS